MWRNSPYNFRMMTIRNALQQAIERLHRSPTARLDAQVLLCHVLGVEKPYLIAHDDRMLTADEVAQFNALIVRRENDEPIAYIMGHQEFWDLDFLVTSSVLIPRPETEHLVELALDYAHKLDSCIAVDIGTGSGAIAVTLAKRSQARVFAVDISEDALAIARKNAEKNAVDIEFFHGSLAQPLINQGIKVHLLMANLPYICSDEMPELAVTKHEPSLALDGGDDGLDLVRELLLQAPVVCHPNALILLEIGMEQGQAVVDFANEHLAPKSAKIIQDLAGLDRIVKIVM